MRIQEQHPPTTPVAVSTQPAPTPKVTPKCEVVDLDGGEGALCTFHIDSFTLKRLKSRAGTMPLDRYLWENILHRAVVDSVL